MQTQLEKSNVTKDTVDEARDGRTPCAKGFVLHTFELFQQSLGNLMGYGLNGLVGGQQNESCFFKARMGKRVGDTRGTGKRAQQSTPVCREPHTESFHSAHVRQPKAQLVLMGLIAEQGLDCEQLLVDLCRALFGQELFHEYKALFVNKELDSVLNHR